MLLYLRFNIVNLTMIVYIIINAQQMETSIAIHLYGQFLKTLKSSKHLDGIKKKLSFLLKIKVEPHLLTIQVLTK